MRISLAQEKRRIHIMTNKDKLIQMINNLNENGVNSLYNLFGEFDKIERYNINTTLERIAELQQIEKQKAEQEKAERKAEREKASCERASAEYIRQKEYIASLTGKEKRFFEVIESIKSTNWSRYCFDTWELMLLADAYDNNLINGGLDIFRYGFMKGQRSEKNRRKRGHANG
jgi:hypothetical protein